MVYGQQPSASTQNMQGVHDVLEVLDNKIITMLLGLYPSALPEKTMKDEKCTFVCKGEGPFTIHNLLQDVKLKDVPGLWYRDGDDIVGYVSKAGKVLSDNEFDAHLIPNEFTEKLINRIKNNPIKNLINSISFFY